jgi:hypothetical protein
MQQVVNDKVNALNVEDEVRRRYADGARAAGLRVGERSSKVNQHRRGRHD